MIPGLAQAEIIRYGVMHRNTFISAPALLLPTYQLKNREEFFVAGQLSGVEGYVESIASGFVAGINAARLAQGDGPIVFPLETMIGAQAQYIANADSAYFQPMNINFGLVPPIIDERNKKNNKALVAARSLEKMEKFIEVYQLDQQGNN
jgi:methylenetetrahydrofolate--tRNA-(uracil-5-)-methyltransferase